MATAAASTQGPNHAAREARRRRIIERGADRLALISGRIDSLPAEPHSDQSPPSTSPPSQIHTIDSSAQHEDASFNPSLPNEETINEEGNETVEPRLHNNQNGDSIPSRSVALHDTKEGSSRIPSSSQIPAYNHQHVQTHSSSIFTPGQIKSAVAASENTRMSCSVAAAVLVIASCMGLPVLGTQGIILFRPVYLLLLTNITIVLGCAFLRARGDELRAGRRSRAPAVDGNDLANQLGRTLELGLLMQKLLGAVFMDFSIYAIVLVSGLSIVQRLGW